MHAAPQLASANPPNVALQTEREQQFPPSKQSSTTGDPASAEPLPVPSAINASSPGPVQPSVEILQKPSRRASRDISPTPDSGTTPATSTAPASKPSVDASPRLQPIQAAPLQVSPQVLSSSTAAAQLFFAPSADSVKEPGDESADPKQSQPSDTSPATQSSAGISEALLAQSLSNLPFTTRTDNFAFALRLEQTNSEPTRSPAAPVPPPRSQVDNAKIVEKGKNDDRLTADPPPATPSKASRDTSDIDLAKATDSPMRSPVNEMAVLAQPEFRSMPVTPEPAETAQVSSSPGTYDLQQVPVEAPKTAAATQIQLHLSGNDTSSASIRVMDRGGAVNVSVHASDPQLRNSLRSNLSELSGQLSSQGWKSDVRTAALAAPNGGAPDSGADGKNSFNQQQKFAQGERQDQRDRRGNSADWQDEFEEQITSNNNLGGTH